MTAMLKKLAIKLKDAELAARLYEAGFQTPRDLRRASDKELEAIPGIGKATVQSLRKKMT